MTPHARILAALAALAIAPAVQAQKDQALQIFVRPDKGHCVACHQVAGDAGPATRSNVGPVLSGARMRELGAAALRDLLQDPMRRNPDTVMPPYGKHHILDAREIDLVTEYLLALP
jgi:sulfur-oxidizing protein SoxX